MHIQLIALIGMTALSLSGIWWQRLEQPANQQALQFEMVDIPAGSLEYRPPGEYLSGGKPISGATVTTELDQFDIMKFQVTSAQYQQCVDEAACKPLDRGTIVVASLPATGVNYFDAVAFAAWLSQRTGETWRLPTDAEWSYAAAERYAGDILAGSDDPENPAIAWIRRYREQAELRREPEPGPRPMGHYGENRFGVADMSGNIWEWTSDCYARVAVDPVTGGTIQRVENCGVHVLGGRHRTYMSDFIRDGKSGGCAAGLAPDNLGFRLVREQPSALNRLGKVIRRNIAGVN